MLTEASNSNGGCGVMVGQPTAKGGRYATRMEVTVLDVGSRGDALSKGIGKEYILFKEFGR